MKFILFRIDKLLPREIGSLKSDETKNKTAKPTQNQILHSQI